MAWTMPRRISRRRLLAVPPALALAGMTAGAARGQTPSAALADHLVIDIAYGPASLDPALARSMFDWSIIHSVYDSVVNLNADGTMAPLAAESLAPVDATTFELRLRPGLTFHDGTPVEADAVGRSIRHVQASQGPAAGNFGVIEEVQLVDALTARIVTREPAPWLPSQLAPWMVLFPEGATSSFETAPVGSGPYRFAAMEPGASVTLERNPAYPADSPKGRPLAERVTYRFVPEATTRVADLLSGTAQVADAVPLDQAPHVEAAGASIVDAPVLGISFLRVVNDAPPFDDPRVRQALNHAVDAGTIAGVLVSPSARRTASIYPDDRSIGFDPELPPFTWDPGRARELLAEAGHPDGIDARMQFTGGGREDVMQALAANMGDAGIRVTLETTELTTFNGTWQDPDSAPLRFVTWRPVYDPHTLLSLMFASGGPLSRFADAEADRLIEAAASEQDPVRRAAIYQELGRHFQASPPAVFLWNLTATYGVRDAGLSWSPRADEYILPTATEPVP